MTNIHRSITDKISSIHNLLERKMNNMIPCYSILNSYDQKFNVCWDGFKIMEEVKENICDAKYKF